MHVLASYRRSFKLFPIINYIAVPPIVTVHPQSKMRFSDDAVTFCCDGEGNPSPEIEW